MSTPVRQIVQKTLSPRIFKTPNSSLVLKEVKISQDSYLKRSADKTLRSPFLPKSRILLRNELDDLKFCKYGTTENKSNNLDDFVIRKPKGSKSIQNVDSEKGSFLEVPKHKYIPSVNSTPEREEFLKTDLSNLNLNVLGKGTFGTVVLAMYKGKDVALKIIPKKTTSSMLETNAINLSHPNILKVLLVVNCSNYNLVIMDSCCASDMQSILDTKDKDIPFEIYTKWVLDICEGLQYCHQNRILHLDVKPKNILVKENNCLLCDFGSSLNLDCSEQREEYLSKLLKGCGGSTIAYNAPEMLYGSEIPNVSTDVYALGVTMYHIHTRVPPYYYLDSVHTIIYQVVKHSLRPKIPKFLKLSCSCESRYCNLYKLCWAQISSHRPSIKTVIDILKLIKKDHNKGLCSNPKYSIL